MYFPGLSIERNGQSAGLYVRMTHSFSVSGQPMMSPALIQSLFAVTNSGEFVANSYRHPR